MKTRSILVAALAIGSGISFTSCEKIKGKGETITETRTVTGLAGQEYLKISGSGNIELSGVQAEEVRTQTSGSGDMYVQAILLLDVSISGSGDIYYLGNPVINTHISGSGNIRRL